MTYNPKNNEDINKYLKDDILKKNPDKLDINIKNLNSYIQGNEKESSNIELINDNISVSNFSNTNSSTRYSNSDIYKTYMNPLLSQNDQYSELTSNTTIMAELNSIPITNKNDTNTTAVPNIKSIIKEPSYNFDDKIKHNDERKEEIEKEETNKPEESNVPEKKKKIKRKIKRIIINKKTGERKEIIDNYVSIVSESEAKELIKKKKLAEKKSSTMGSFGSICSLYANKKLYPDDNKKYKVVKKTVKVTRRKDYEGDLNLDEEQLDKIRKQDILDNEIYGIPLNDDNKGNDVNDSSESENENENNNDKGKIINIDDIQGKLRQQYNNEFHNENEKNKDKITLSIPSDNQENVYLINNVSNKNENIEINEGEVNIDNTDKKDENLVTKERDIVDNVNYVDEKPDIKEKDIKNANTNDNYENDNNEKHEIMPVDNNESKDNNKEDNIASTINTTTNDNNPNNNAENSFFSWIKNKFIGNTNTNTDNDNSVISENNSDNDNPVVSENNTVKRENEDENRSVTDDNKHKFTGSELEINAEKEDVMGDMININSPLSECDANEFINRRRSMIYPTFRSPQNNSPFDENFSRTRRSVSLCSNPSSSHSRRGSIFERSITGEKYDSKSEIEGTKNVTRKLSILQGTLLSKLNSLNIENTKIDNKNENDDNNNNNNNNNNENDYRNKNNNDDIKTEERNIEEEKQEEVKVDNKLKKDIKDNNKPNEDIKDDSKSKEEAKIDNKPNEDIKDDNKSKEDIKVDSKSEEDINDDNKPKEDIRDDNKSKEDIRDDNKPKEEAKVDSKLNEDIKKNNDNSENVLSNKAEKPGTN